MQEQVHAHVALRPILETEDLVIPAETQQAHGPVKPGEPLVPPVVGGDQSPPRTVFLLTEGLFKWIYIQ